MSKLKVVETENMPCKKESNFCPVKRLTTRRQKVIADREQELLVLAEEVMEQHGFSGLTMDKVVSACSCSKGTVYNHFSSKEDLFCALCVKSMRQMLVLFKRAIQFEGTSREKMLACHFAYRLHALMNPTLFMTVLATKAPAVQEKASKVRLEEQNQLDHEITMMCDELHQEAVKNGELKVSVALSVASLVFASWAMAFGSNSLLMMTANVEGIERLEKDTALLINASLLMDGMQWKPLSSEWDYQNTWQRVSNEVFAKEVAALHKAVNL